MGPNVVVGREIIKHLFDRGVSHVQTAQVTSQINAHQNLSVVRFILQTRSLTCSGFERMIE
jgi:hypothetical protein